MKVRSNTVATAGTVVATAGSGIAASGITGSATIGGIMETVGTSSLFGGHVVTVATPLIAAAAPVAIAVAGGVLIGYAAYKVLED